MSGNPERCVQRRFTDFLKEHFPWVFFLPLILLIIVILLFHLLGMIKPGDMIDVLLALVIAFFSGVQGYSTLSQVRLAKKRNRIEDLRNELEKAYGPLFTLVNIPDFTSKKGVLLPAEQKWNMDEIMANHPFMFPPEIYDLWRDKIQPALPPCLIPLELRDKINRGYTSRVQEYRELLKKE